LRTRGFGPSLVFGGDMDDSVNYGWQHLMPAFNTGFGASACFVSMEPPGFLRREYLPRHEIVLFVCEHCGAKFDKWQTNCTNCGALMNGRKEVL